MRTSKKISFFAAVMLCMTVFLLPLTVHAQTDKDTTPPALTTKLEDGMLYIESSDDMSGVEAVYIDNTRVNTLVNGKASVLLKDYAGNNKQVSVYAVDAAGNRSEVIKLDNPNYVAPAPLSSSSAPASSSSSAPAASSSSSSSSQPVQSSSSATASSSVSSVEVPFTPDGQGTVIDQATDADGKDFYTIVTADGNVFYLIIDQQKGTQNVYFLRTVTEQDLLALSEKAKETPNQGGIPAPISTPQSESQAESEAQSEPEQKPDGNSGSGSWLLILLAVAAVGGAGWYFKIHKPKQDAALLDELDEPGEEEAIQFEEEPDAPEYEEQPEEEDAYQDDSEDYEDEQF